MNRFAFLALWGSSAAWAQVELVDPDVKTPPKAARPKPEAAPEGAARQPIDLKPGEEIEVAPEEPEEPLPAPKEPIKAKKPEPKKVELAPAPKPSVPPIHVTRLVDADLDAAWDRWRLANESFTADPKAEANARADLLRLKGEIGALDIEAWSVALMRSAVHHEAGGSSAVAIEQALAAVELAPNIPSSHFGLARAYFAADPSDVGRYLQSVGEGATRLLSEPRYQRPLLADVATALMAAIALTGVLVVGVLFARRARYFFYDVHFLFPRAVPRWQTSAIALVLVSLPVVFRLGLVPTLLCAFAAVTFYLSFAERLVSAVLIALIGLLPVLGSLLVRVTAFADTAAESAWQLDRGAPGAEAVAQRATRRASEDKASADELIALGSFELRRGKLDLAVPRLKAALAKSPNEPRAQVNLAVAMLLSGDLDNPPALLEAAKSGAPDLAAPWFNLARWHQRRVQTLGVEAAASDVDKANEALGQARARDPALAERPEPAPDKQQGNTLLITLPLSNEQLLGMAVSPDAEERVRSQLSLMILGNVNAPWAPLYPAAAAFALMALGGLAMRVSAARGCGKCGMPMSRREDPDLSPSSVMCTQCVNVYSRKGVVPPALKVRKQVEVARYQSRMERLSFGLGLLCSGMGHVFKGLPVRGTAYAFLFVFAVVAVTLRDGVLRSPFEGLPMWLKLLPVGLLLLSVYALSVRALFKKQGSETG